MGADRPSRQATDHDSEQFWRARPNLAAPGLSKRGGRGLIALSPIAAGVLIDRACTVEIDATQAEPLDRMQPIGDYYFAHPDNAKAGLMAFGMVVLCNHAEDANGNIVWWKSPDLGWFADLIAQRDIAAGEEITFRYRCPLWFAPES
ncbi:SET domain-containing protein-lysine N-methyltransferase [Hyphococcus sp.]|uniref:SET domain-containing protein-lysine N-methyltransferase n=1 Tax=Hyphococcus sp. TaxID=2038636 RepID=UPI00208CEA22|nr:MAG: hypothetical protein DHS20C04_26260 [Marinicaulis sp.]